jgi:predicted enzyme related to lactoylglutathione lyase
MPTTESLPETPATASAPTPNACGAFVYLNCDSGLAAALDRIHAGKRGELIVPITKVPGGFGSFAVIRDSQGNHVELHQH